MDMKFKILSLEFCSIFSFGNLRGHVFSVAFFGIASWFSNPKSRLNVKDLDLIPGLGRNPEGKGYPFQNSGLENS